MLARLKQSILRPWPLFAALLVIYAALLLPTVARQGISWDEQTDINITHAIINQPDGWLTGSPIDPSQTRLPMAAVALVYALLGSSDLLTGRLVSCLVGALTLLGVFQYARMRFTPAAGLLAAAVLATSPFFLSFARIAFTESDIYLACAFIWLLVTLARYQDQPTLPRAAWVGLLWGLCLSAKFTALAVLPVVWIGAAQVRSQPAATRKPVSPLLWTVWLLAAALIAWGAPNFNLIPGGPAGRLIHAAVVLSAWAAALAWAFTRQRQTAGWAAACGFITALGILTFLVVPPEHFGNPAILRSLLWRAEHEMAFHPGFILEAAGLHILSILVKSSLLIGLGLLASLFFALRQWRRNEVRLPALMILFYFGGLILLPIAQTFYSIPILPLLALLAADLFLRLFSRRRLAALLLGAAAALTLAVDLWLCYPDYNLNGYQWLGARVLLGRSSIGYRSVVQTTSDGVEQAIQWLNRHAGRGETVLAYIAPWHIVEANAPQPVYILIDALNGGQVRDPDYVVVHINEEIWQGWGLDTPVEPVIRYPYDRSWLENNYTKVFSVPRAFGIEMASVWKRKGAPGSEAP